MEKETKEFLEDNEAGLIVQEFIDKSKASTVTLIIAIALVKKRLNELEGELTRRTLTPYGRD